MYLSSEPFDILNLYTEFRFSAFSGDYPRDAFLRLPLGYIYELLKRNTEAEKRRANIYSISTARLTSVVLAVANGFSGNKSECKVKIDELLPFPLDSTAYEKDNETTDTVKKLIREGKLPIHVIAALSKVVTM